jgi:predicted nucleic acid-binding protein
MTIALDTNVLAYVEGVNGPELRARTAALIQRLPEDELRLPVQVLGELFNVLVRKARYTRGTARAVIQAWRASYPVLETSERALLAAAGLATDHHLSIWDAVILSVAAQAGCRLLLSEDLQDGFVWGGVTVANPYADTMHPLLAALLAEPDRS